MSESGSGLRKSQSGSKVCYVQLSKEQVVLGDLGLPGFPPPVLAFAGTFWK